MTPAEALLWQHLKGQKTGAKFRRQHSVGSYVLDFYCPAKRLAVELDGKHHYTPEGLARDSERTRYLTEFNIRVIRFENHRVLEGIEEVLAEIRSAL